jgi:hypothetical protein
MLPGEPEVPRAHGEIDALVDDPKILDGLLDDRRRIPHSLRARHQLRFLAKKGGVAMEAAA